MLPPEVYATAAAQAARGELNDYLATHRELNDERGIANVASQVLAALLYLHGCAAIHHDVKPPNVLATACADTHTTGLPWGTSGIRVLALRAPHVLEAQGSSAPVPPRTLRTSTSYQLAVRRTCRVPWLPR